jgi:hypothetical protein
MLGKKNILLSKPVYHQKFIPKTNESLKKYDDLQIERKKKELNH